MILGIVKKLEEYSFDFEQIEKDVQSIIKKYPLPQIGLTHSPSAISALDKVTESTGSIRDHDTGEFRFKESDFTIFNEEFKNTSLYEMYKNVPNIGRFRIMTMNGPSCYTIHTDLTKRYHYVIETNPRCIFLFPGIKQQIHLPCDHHLYLVDTRFEHTFVNGSSDKRIHLVMDDISKIK